VFERLNVALAEDVGSRGIKSKLEPSIVVPYIFSLGSVTVLPQSTTVECGGMNVFQKRKFQIQLNG
jgi:hypothetical protein